MTNQKKQEEGQKGVSPVAAAIAGAVVGAGVAVAGAMVMKDEKTQAKVKEVLYYQLWIEQVSSGQMDRYVTKVSFPVLSHIISIS